MPINGCRKIPSAKNPVKQRQGAVNKAMGHSFEAIIDFALEYYSRRGEAVIMKTPEPMRPIKDLGNGKFVAYYERQAQPDYKGALKGGRAVVFEAKHTTADRIEQHRVTAEQSAVLDKYDAMGAECFVLVGFDLRDLYRIPWPVWRDMAVIYGRRYIKHGELERFAVPMVAGHIRLLDGIEVGKGDCRKKG